MRNLIVSTNNFSKRNMMNSRNGLPLQELEDRAEIHLQAAAIIEDEDPETKELKEIGVLVTPESEYYTTISATVIDTMHDLIDIMDDEGTADVRIGKRVSKGGRTFLTMTIL